MSDIATTVALLARAAPQAVSQGVPATVSNPPPALAQAAAGSVLRGTVTGHDEEGRVLLRTDRGTLTLSTRTPLPVGAQVTLQVRATGNQLQVAIVQVDGRPVAAQAQPPTPGSPQAPTQGPTQSASQAPAQGTLNATSASGQAASAATLRGGSAGVPAANLHGNAPAASAALPHGTTTGPGASAAAAAQGIEDVLALGQRVRAVVRSAPHHSAQTASQVTGSAQALRPGSELLVRILRIEPPATSPNQAAAARAPGTAVPGGATPASTAAATPAQTAPTQSQGTPATAPAVARSALPGPQAMPSETTTRAAPGATASTAGPQGQPSPGPAAALREAVVTNPLAPTQTTTRPGVSPAGAASGAPASRAGSAAAGSGQPAARATGTQTSSPQAMAPQTTAAQPAAGQTAAGQAAGPATAPAALAASARPAAPAAIPSAVASGTGAPLPGMVSEVSAGPGRTLVATALGTLALETGARLPPGTRLEIEVIGRLPLPPEPAARTESQSVLRGWPALDAALRAAAEAAPIGQAETALPHGLSQGLPSGLPQAGPRLASGLLFFLSALASGDMAAWMGQKSLEILNSRGRGDLIAGLAREFAQAGRLAEAAGGDWRFVPLPLFDGQQIQPLRFFFRHGQGHGQGGEAKDAATRFVVEVELTRLGDLQLDGLVRARHFDLILRSRGELPQHMRRDIAAIFQSANEISGSDGQIAFQAGRGWAFLPLEKDLRSRGAEAAGALLV